MLQYGNSLARELGDCIRMCMCIMCGMQENKYKQPKFVECSTTDAMYYRLTAMINEGRFNEAENIMSEYLDATDLDDYYMMLCIYDYMNDFEDEFLEQNNFSREEIQEGVVAISRHFDVEGVYSFLHTN